MINDMQNTSPRWKTGLIWLIVILVGLGGAATYLHQNPDQVPEWAAKSGLGRELQSTTVYKWQDDAGNWHISDQKPAESVEYQEGQYARDTNVLPLPPELEQ